MSNKITVANVTAYLQGNIRYWLYYRYPKMIRLHIREQINLRIASMEMQCLISGSCILCGCTTTALQMANKACDKPCYPHMMTKKVWNDFKAGVPYRDFNKRYIWTLVNGKFYLEKF